MVHYEGDKVTIGVCKLDGCAVYNIKRKHCGLIKE
jgi:hypothetical protein